MAPGDQRKDIAWHHTRGRVLALVIALGAIVVCMAGTMTACTSGAGNQEQASEGDAAVVRQWAREDLDFGPAADCLDRYLSDIDLGGTTRRDLQRGDLDAVPLEIRQRIGDALIVCGIANADR